MKGITLLFALATIVIVSVFYATQARAGDDGPANDKPTEMPAKVAILKFDDLGYNNEQFPPDGIHPLFRKTIDYCIERGIKSSYGIFGKRVEDASPEYCEWIKGLHESGMVEFWCHGYLSAPPEKQPDGILLGEFERPYEEQLDLLKKSQDVAMRKFGFTYTTFGQHYSGINADTARAIKEIPEIKIVFTWPPNLAEAAGVMRLPRTNLENPTGSPKFEVFKRSFDQRGGASPVVIQGHPWGFHGENWDELVKVIDFLLEDGWTFMTPSEYHDAMTKNE